MSATGQYIGLDIGSSSIKVCLIDTRGNMIARYSTSALPLDSAEKCARFVAQLSAYVRQQRLSTHAISGIGIGIPGTLQGAHVEMIPNACLDLPALLECLRDEFPYAGLAYVNDANAAAYAEARRGFAAGADSSLFVCLGMGIGSGVVIDGALMTGHNGAAGEIGHMKVVKGGRRCGCGGSGCLEQYASARGIVRTFREVDANNPMLYADLEAKSNGEIAGLRPRHATDSYSVLRAYAAGDVRAHRAIEVLCKTLGFALAQVACVLDPQVILLGGGVSNGFELFGEQLVEEYRSCCIGPCEQTPIYPAQLGVDAGAWGAALYAQDYAE